jgi:glycosyltransferase involved in cell wall biosynthesis
MVNKLVSIIIPVYNSKKYILKCLNSVINQTYKNIEVILIDDGSTDETVKIIENAYKYDNRVKIYNQKNSGPSSARNNGISKAKGEYIFFIDSDDYIDKYVIENLISHYKEDYLNGVNYKIINNEKIKKIVRDDCIIDQMYEKIVDGSIGGFIWGYIFEREKIKSIKFDSEINYMEDMIFLLEYCKQVNGVHYNKNSFYNYLLNEASISHSSDNILKNIKAINYVIKKIKSYFFYNKLEISNSNLIKIKIRLIDSEIGKITKVNDIKVIKGNSEFKIIMEKLLAETDNLYLSTYIKMFLIKTNIPVYIYINIRKLLKKIKGCVLR